MRFKSLTNPQFRNKISEDIFNQKYRHDGAETWDRLSRTLADDVCKEFLDKDEVDGIYELIRDMKFIPGGRYLYYAGRPVKFFNNCYLMKAEEDSREDWANLSWKAESALLTGGGIGVDYSVYRPSGSLIRRTGGYASGPIPKMMMINEIGRHVMQGGSRRSAIYASLSWKHKDIEEFLHIKDWFHTPIPGTGTTIGDAKRADFNYPAPLDMTNISINYDTEWVLRAMQGDYGEIFERNVRQAMMTGEPGFSFNFFDKENETLRNAYIVCAFFQ